MYHLREKLGSYNGTKFGKIAYNYKTVKVYPIDNARKDYREVCMMYTAIWYHDWRNCTVVVYKTEHYHVLARSFNHEN